MQVPQREGAFRVGYGLRRFQVAAGRNQRHAQAFQEHIPGLHGAGAVMIAEEGTGHLSEGQSAAERSLLLIRRPEVEPFAPSGAVLSGDRTVPARPGEDRAFWQLIFQVIPARHDRVEQEGPVLRDLRGEGLALLAHQPDRRSLQSCFLRVPAAVVIRVRENRALHRAGHDHPGVQAGHRFAQRHLEGLRVALPAG